MANITEFRGPHVDGDETESRVFDGLPVFPLHLSKDPGWSVPHHHNHLFFIPLFHLIPM